MVVAPTDDDEVVQVQQSAENSVVVENVQSNIAPKDEVIQLEDQDVVENLTSPREE